MIDIILFIEYDINSDKYETCFFLFENFNFIFFISNLFLDYIDYQ